MTTRPQGFVALSSLKQGHPSSDEALAEIRRMYFKTTARTIEHDLAHAIELLKGLDSEAAREKASVFMEGLAELRKEWSKGDQGPGHKAHGGARPKAEGSRRKAGQGPRRGKAKG